MIANIQALRAYAAAIVVIGHAWNILPGSDSFAIKAAIAYFGYTGVDIFFVISGFIIHGNIDAIQNAGRVRSAVDFLVRRIRRLYPTYWVVLLASWLIFHFLSVVPEPGMPVSSSLSLLSLASRDNWLVPQAWTLTFEMGFYLIASLLIAISPRPFFLVSLCVGLFFMMNMIFAALSFPAMGASISGFGLEFILGIISSRFYTRYKTDKYQIFVFSGIILYLFSVYAARNTQYTTIPDIRALTFAVSAALFIYGIACAEQLSNWRAPAWLVSLGDVSYEIYLWHVAVLVCLRAWIFGGQPNPSWAAFLGALLVILCLSYASRALIESLVRRRPRLLAEA